MSSSGGCGNHLDIGRHERSRPARKVTMRCGDCGARVFLQEMAAGHEERPFGVREHALEPLGEGRGVEHVVLAPPDQQASAASIATARCSSHWKRSVRARRLRRAESSAARPRSAVECRDRAARLHRRPVRDRETFRDGPRTDTCRAPPALRGARADKDRPMARASGATETRACGILPAASATPTCS